jgi:hypothetical protein
MTAYGLLSRILSKAKHLKNIAKVIVVGNMTSDGAESLVAERAIPLKFFVNMSRQCEFCS